MKRLTIEQELHNLAKGVHLPTVREKAARLETNPIKMAQLAADNGFVGLTAAELLVTDLLSPSHKGRIMARAIRPINSTR